jgi:hypothetical protein
MAGVDQKLLNRLSFQGAPDFVFPCTWGRKPAGLAVVGSQIVLAAAGLVGTTTAAPMEHTRLTLADGSSGTLQLWGERHSVHFAEEADAKHLLELLAAEKARIASLDGDRTPLVIAQDDRLVPACTFIGGAYLDLAQGATVDLVFGSDGLQFYPAPARQVDAELASIRFGAEFSIELTGPGKVTSGGGFMGGGFGLVGAVEGMAIASFLNKITTSTRIVTVIVVGDHEHEGFFVNTTLTPEQLRRHLSPVFVRLRNYRATPGAEQRVEQPVDLIANLERLSALHQSGALDDNEFALAKQTLLGPRQ